MSHQRRILYVQGFHHSTRAKDLAYEFERYGRLVRCDVPARRDGQRASYAFIEFKDDRDAADAYHDMHGRSFEGHRLSVQWAKNPPSSVWRFENKPASAPPRRGSPPRERDRDREHRNSRDENDRGDRDREYRSSRDDYDRDRDAPASSAPSDRDNRHRSRSPAPRDRGTYDRRDDRDRDRERERRRSPEPDRDRDRDRRSSRKSLSPRVRTPPRENGRERDERPITPPYDH